MGLNKENVAALVSATLKNVRKNGASFYGWKNSPAVDGETWTQVQGWGENASEVEIPASEAEEVFSSKLNGAYGERFAMSVGLISGLVANGYDVRLVQFQSEEGVPFDAKGWIVVIVETMPIFHISPEDLNSGDVEDLVEVLYDNEADDVCWKSTNKVGEFEALLQGSLQSELDLVAIAQSGSK